jgi:hypothetical protein
MALDKTSWTAVVKKKFFTSSEFKALDTAVVAYLADKSKLPGLTTRFNAWNKKFTDIGQTYKDSDRYTAGCALDDIALLVQPARQGGLGGLATQAVALGGGGLRHVVMPPAPYRPPVRNTGTTVAPVGWSYVAYDASNARHNWAGALTGTQALNFSQTARINEAFARTRDAVKQARDALLRFPRDGGAWTNTDDQNSYLDYFGAYDGTRFLHVLENFRILALAFDGNPNVIDIRNTASGGACYAACARANLKSTTSGSLALTGRVDIFLGKAFFNDSGPLSQRYARSTDATVATLVHEFAHGSFKAVDAPKVNPGGTAWTARPANLTVGHDDYGISPDPWRNQASTEDEDKALAKFAPAVAIRSADNYGQFTREVLMRLES